MKRIPVLLIMLIAVACEPSIEQKLKEISFINEKYNSTIFYSTSNIVDSKYKIWKCLSFMQTLYGSDKVKDIAHLNDSIFNVAITKTKIDVNQFKKDTADINKILPGYFDSNNKSNLDIEVTKAISTAYGNNSKVTYSDIVDYIVDGKFKNGESKETSTPKTHKESIDKNEVEKWMSGWDGSISDFEKQIKNNLNDPDSFKHVETSYNIKRRPIIVRMKFRCKNSYNATVTNIAEGVLNTSNGTVSDVKITQQ